MEVRDKIAFIQDVFVRDVNSVSVAKQGNDTVDSQALEARLLADARKVMGTGKVASIAIVQLQVAPLHPNSPATPRRSRRRTAAGDNADGGKAGAGKAPATAKTS